MSSFGKQILRSITGSLGLFLAIMGIVALGCGFYAGLRMTGPDMRAFQDAYFDATRLFDVRVVGTLGFSDAGVEQVRDASGADGVMAVKSTDVMVDYQSEQFAMRMSTLPGSVARSVPDGGAGAASDDADFLNRPVLVEGRWPERVGECVISADRKMPSDDRIGQTIHVLYGTQDADDVLATRDFEVVGLAHSPLYVSSASMGSTQLGSGNIVQFMLVTADSFAPDVPYTEVYLAYDAAVPLDATGDAYEAFVDGKRALVEAAAARIAAARLEEVRAEAQDELDEAREQLDDARAQVTALTALSFAALGSADASYDPLVGEANDELAEAQAAIDEAQEQLDGLEPPDVYVLDRSKNEGAYSFRSDSERIDHIAAVFPFIFFLVAALVALTTMTRLVEEERVTIGTFKALGYSKAAITAKYLVYAAAASVTGAVVGILVLSQVLPYVVCSAYAIVYSVPIPPLPLPVDVPLALLAAVMGCAVTLLATWGAVAATLREQPASLMLPRAPASGKRILLERVRPLWRRLNFTWKVTCRNIFRYKKRLVMTVIGIAGCTALLLTGFGLHNSIWDIIDEHYGKVVHYNLTVTLAEDADEASADELAAYLEESPDIADWVAVGTTNMQVRGSADRAVTTELVIPRAADELPRVIDLHERGSAAAVPFDADAVVLTEKLADLVGAHAGDEVLLFTQDAIGNAEGAGMRVRVDAVCEFYIGNAVFIGRDAYERLLGEGPAFSTMLCCAAEDEAAEARLADQLHALDAVETVTFNRETVERWRTMLDSVNMIVVVLIVSAAALAFIVLYNLTNINITERRREIASLKVLGFLSGEVDAYIFREIALLAAAGALIGLALGVWMEGFVVVTAEVDYVMFGRAIHAASYVYAFALTLLFTALVMLIMRRKLRGIDMIESLKSVE